MLRKRVLFAVLCCVAACGVSAASLTGTVQDEAGNAISGARVSLKNLPDNVATTNASGEFSITGLAARLLNKTKTSSLSAGMNNNNLYFHTGKTVKKAVISVYSLTGAQIVSFSEKDLASGTHRFSLAGKLHGPALIQLSLDNERYVAKAVPGVNAVFSNASSESGAASLSKSAAAAEDFVDSLIVTAPSYRHALTGVTSYDAQGISINLTKSNPWQPAAGSLVHENGMVKILANGYDFEMGQMDSGLLDSAGNNMSNTEQPAHTVKFTYDFWMDTTEVTQGNYDAIMSAYYSGYGTTHAQWSADFGLGSNYPAYYVHSDDAQLYCNALSKRDGFDTVYSYAKITGTAGQWCTLKTMTMDRTKNGYRLPTEAEWEYACKGGTFGFYYWQTDLAATYEEAAADTASISQNAIWYGNSKVFGIGNSPYGSAQVASKKSNAYGLYDMLGNVQEACDDWDGAYTWGTVTDPTGAADGNFIENRGGTWANKPVSLRATSRLYDTPDYPFIYLGFRVVRPIK